MYGPAAIGVILTGNLDDGTAGLWTLKQMGGVAVVQDVQDAMFPSMPAHAAKHVDIDYSVPLSQMASLLDQLVNRAPGTTERVVPQTTCVEIDIAKGANPRDAGFEEMAMPSRFACPECHGVLLEVKEAAVFAFVAIPATPIHPRACSPTSIRAFARRWECPCAPSRKGSSCSTS